MINNGSHLSAVVSRKEVPGYLYGNGINKSNNNNEFISLINTMRRQDNSRNSVSKSRRQAERSAISRRLQDFRNEWLR